MKMICDCDNEDEMADVQVSLEHTVIIVIVIIVHTILTYQAWLVTARCAGDCRATSLRLRLASGQVGPAGGDHDDHDAGGDHDDHDAGVDHDDHDAGSDHDDHGAGSDHDDHDAGGDHDDHDAGSDHDAPP